jgi:hypothetical protein
MQALSMLTLNIATKIAALRLRHPQHSQATTRNSLDEAPYRRHHSAYHITTPRHLGIALVLLPANHGTDESPTPPPISCGSTTEMY